MSLGEMRDFVKKNFFETKNGLTTIISFDDKRTTKELFDQLQVYSFKAAAGSRGKEHKSGTASAEDGDTEHYYIPPQYDDSQLDIIEDVVRNDGVVGPANRKYMFAIMSKHGKSVIDSNLEFTNESDRRKKLEELGKSPRYGQAKQKVDKLITSRDVDFHKQYSELVEQHFAYGRAAGYVGNGGITGMTSLYLLDPKRLGRVKVNKITKKIVAVEYYDCITQDGEFVTIALDAPTAKAGTEKNEPAFIPIENLIYLINSGSGLVKYSKYVGVSKLEPCIHLSQVKRIILNEMLKEAAKALYAGQGRVLFPPETEPSVMDNFITMMKQNVGRWFGYKLQNLEITIEQIKTEIDKYEAVVDLLNREILRTIGLASFLVGYEQIANYANSEQIMLATKELDISYVRTDIKDDIRYDVLDPLFRYFLMFDNKTQVKIDENKRRVRMNPNAVPREGFIEIKDDEMAEYQKQITVDEEVKLVYETQEINFSTRFESAQTADILKRIIPYIPDEAILRLTGMEDWIEETLKNKAEYEEQQLKKAEMEFNQQKELVKARGFGGGGFGGKPSKKEGTASAGREMDLAYLASQSDDPQIRELFKEWLKARTLAYAQYSSTVSQN